VKNDDDEHEQAVQRTLREMKIGHEADVTQARKQLLSVVKLVPILGAMVETGEQVLEGVRAHRLAKLRMFARTFDWCAASLQEEERHKIREILESELGAELLDDYVKKVVDTLSPIVRAALAILFADELVNRYSSAFHRMAARALAGLTDGEVDLFLKFDEIKEDSELFHNVRLSVGNIASFADELRIEPSVGYGLVDSLMNRGLMPRGNLRDAFSQADDFYTILMWGPTSSRYADLLRDAKRILSELSSEAEER
jgi:hypothetical protein